ncbi:hypothetical protein HO173_008283 [Letharia columbiana]|uniref:Uncharacterized protein n=1 Tax=Letharia columbiana TaxID=112416 RepID=A0A8H6FRR5_9LECA|nr:uncharacterized protein HO173_008283 [Letharia columbiana]KAF6233510.1 hypothetical protein HO173_008283 [Letharia columbiana]
MFLPKISLVALSTKPSWALSAIIAGRIVKTFVNGGTHHSEPLFATLVDPLGANNGEEGTGKGYNTAKDTRAMMFIDPDKEDSGLMTLLLLVMQEVSTKSV